ncbi:PqqD family peptide modification chaperone [Yoonia sp. 208BN28-4]|uniref:PqqD family peptide modification chaperone n=1 Tax=Yoonia sp. 208BN28-4 TaxID=3126505 RepID=UPI0030EEE6D1
MCDLAAEMAWERLRSDPTLLCLHAGAVDIGGKLVVLPNGRRAGKSTLSTALGRLGHRLYTDDFLPIRAPNNTSGFVGVANGIAPRIRLPLPTNFSDEFRAWVERDPGPSNKQYKYLLTCPIARGGETMPLGALVILDRQDHPCAPSLQEYSIKDTIATLIAQNFARTLHAGTILESVEMLARQVPSYRLTYHCGEEAAAYLSTHEKLKPTQTAKPTLATPKIRQAPLDGPLQQPAPLFERTCRYVQAPNVTKTEAGSEHFLADGSGIAIHRLNAGSAAIWNLLKEPADLNEVVDILVSAFDDVVVDQVQADSECLMRSLAEANLIVPALPIEVVS